MNSLLRRIPWSHSAVLHASDKNSPVNSKDGLDPPMLIIEEYQEDKDKNYPLGNGRRKFSLDPSSLSVEGHNSTKKGADLFLSKVMKKTPSLLSMSGIEEVKKVKNSNSYNLL